MSCMAPTSLAARLVSASTTAMRPDAGASMIAMGVRSPIAMAWPATVSKPDNVTAHSATGTCQGPTTGSRAPHHPPLRPLARRAACRHPVRRQFDVVHGSYVACRKIGQRLDDGHASGCRGVEDRDGSAFTHCHGLAGNGLETR